jgi:hypothetical protein
MDASGTPVPAIEEIYDEQVLARIDAASGHAPAPVPGRDPSSVDVVVDDDGAGSEGAGGAWSMIPRYPVARRIGAAVLAGAMLGVAEVLEPERARHQIIDYAPDLPDEDTQLVTFHMVPGDPRASRLVVRPWLLGRFRRAPT